MTEHALTEPTSVFVSAGPAIDCPTCGVVFWMTIQLYDVRHTDHKTFYCPNGDRLHWNQESEAERYQRLYKEASDRTAAVRAERDQAEAGRRAWKGQATKLRKRAAAGECPFCGEHVYQLDRHVSRRHPNEADAAALAEATLPEVAG